MTRRIPVALWLAACTRQPPTAPAARLGGLMSPIGRRFELLGRAVQAKRWEPAEFDGATVPRLDAVP